MGIDLVYQCLCLLFRSSQDKIYTMAARLGLTFDDDILQAVLTANPSIFDTNSASAMPPLDDWKGILDLKKRQTRISIHGTIMAEYLRNDCAPMGLIVTNAPRLFLDDKTFLRDWSLIAWRCTRDWLILIISTAKRVADALLVEIQTLEGQIKATVSHIIFKKSSDDSNKTNREYKDNILSSKIDKFRKDLAKFTLEKVYPYTKADYVPPQFSRRGRKLGSDYSSTDSDSTEGEGSGRDTARNSGRRGNRGRGRRGMGGQQYQQGPWWPPAPWGFQQVPGYPPMPPFPPQNMQSMYNYQPFLGQGTRHNRGKRRGQNQVRWDDEHPTLTNQGRADPTQPGTSAT